MSIPFYNRFHALEETEWVTRCLAGQLASENACDGQACRAVQEALDTQRILLTPSCTAALELAIACAGIGRGDEVILPSFNFPSAANAVLRSGATPVLCDIDPATQNISVEDAARCVTPRTKAVIAVHYAGVAADMDALGALCRAHALLLIEDAAQGIGATWDDRPLGTIGDFGALSFHATKSISCGEGGVLCVPQQYWEAAQIFRMHGTDRSRMLCGEQDRYTWQRAGSCYLMPALCQSVLCAQMPFLGEVTQKRRMIASAYNKLFANLPVHQMQIPDKAGYNGHIYYLRFETERQRDHVLRRLAAQEIDCKTHYYPLHMSPAGKALGYAPDDLLESKRCYETLLRLPMHTAITLWDAERVADAVREALETG